MECCRTILASILLSMLCMPTVRAGQPAEKSTDGVEFQILFLGLHPSEAATAGMGLNKLTHEFSVYNATLKTLLSYAYGVRPMQVIGGPIWTDSQSYDLKIKVPSTLGSGPMADDAERRKMVQAILASHFKLKLRKETKDMTVTALVVDSDGSHLTESWFEDWQGLSLESGHLVARGAPVDRLAEALGAALKVPIIDRTGLKDLYDFSAVWAPLEPEFFKWKVVWNAGPLSLEPQPPVSSEKSDTSLQDAVRHQLGLKLENGTYPVEVFAVDGAESPASINDSM